MLRNFERLHIFNKILIGTGAQRKGVESVRDGKFVLEIYIYLLLH